MKLFFVLGLLSATPIAKHQHIGSISQKASCAVAGVMGNVTVNCPGVSPAALRTLENSLTQEFKARIKDLDEQVREMKTIADDWQKRYFDLVNRLATSSIDTALKRKAETLLKEGKLSEAGDLLDKELEAGERSVDDQAEAQFERATLYMLEFRIPLAQAHYKKAYEYRPLDLRYGRGYADTLTREGDFAKAETIYIEVIRTARALAANDLTKTSYEFAGTLNNLGFVYQSEQRFSEALETYKEALDLYRKCEVEHHGTYASMVAGVLSNLAGLHRIGGDLKQASSEVSEALLIRERLAVAESQQFLPLVADALDTRGNIYSDLGRSEDALDDYRRALKIYLEIAKDQSAYSTSIAVTSMNLGNLYSSMHQYALALNVLTEDIARTRECLVADPQAFKRLLAQELNSLGTVYGHTNDAEKAEGAYAEALELYKELYAEEPMVYAPLVASAFFNRGVLRQLNDEPREALRDYADSLRFYLNTNKVARPAYSKNVVGVLGNMAALTSLRGDPDEAERLVLCSDALVSFELSSFVMLQGACIASSR